MKKFVWFRKDVETIKGKCRGEIEALNNKHKEEIEAMNYAFDYTKSELKMLKEEYESMTKAAVTVITEHKEKAAEAMRQHDLAEMRFNHLLDIARKCSDKGRYSELKKFVAEYDNGEWTREDFGVVFSETEFDDIVKEVEEQ